MTSHFDLTAVKLFMPLSPSSIRACLIAFGLLTIRFHLALDAHAAFRPPETSVIDLPEFKVTAGQDWPAPEKWRYARIPGFEILTNAPDRSTQRLIDDFIRFQQALSLVWPKVENSSSGAALILCGTKGKFDAFVPAEKPPGEIAGVSLFLKNREQTSIVIDLETTVVDVSGGQIDDPASGTNSNLFSVEHNQQLYREYVRYLLSQVEPRLPPWFEEGMAQIVMAMKFDRKLVEFGKLADPKALSAAAGLRAQVNATGRSEDPAASLNNSPVEDRDFNAALSHGALIPFDQFFAVKADSPEATNPLGNNRWAKQAYAFVHLCLYGEHQKYNQPFATFLMRSAKEPVTESLFKECFKQSYHDMLLTLRGYVQFANYKSQEFRIKGAGLPSPPRLTLRDATPAEIGRIKGTALIAAGHLDAARLELVAPYVRGERDPQLLAELGIYEEGNQHDERARKFLETAVAAQVDRPRAYLELSQLRLQADLAGRNVDASLSEAQLRDVLAPLLVGRQQNPRLPEIYDAVANAWSHTSVTPQHDDVAILIEGAQIFPHRLSLVYEAAALSLKAGLNDAATRLIDFGLQASPNPTAKAKFTDLKARLRTAAAVP